MILFELCIRKWIILLYKLQFMSFVDVHKTCMFTQRTGMLSHMTDGDVSKNGVRTLISFLAFTWKICYYIITLMPPSEIFKGHRFVLFIVDWTAISKWCVFVYILCINQTALFRPIRSHPLSIFLFYEYSTSIWLIFESLTTLDTNTFFMNFGIIPFQEK